MAEIASEQEHALRTIFLQECCECIEFDGNFLFRRRKTECKSLGWTSLESLFEQALDQTSVFDDHQFGEVGSQQFLPASEYEFDEARIDLTEFPVQIYGQGRGGSMF